MIASYRQTHSPSQLAWSEVSNCLDAALHSSDEPGETLSRASVILGLVNNNNNNIHDNVYGAVIMT